MVIFPLPEEERAAAVELLKRAVAEKVAPAPRAPRHDARPGRIARRAVAAAYCDGSEEGKLRHRYEMAIDRSLRATIQQLIALEKSGADLAGAVEEAVAEDDPAGGGTSEVTASQSVTSNTQVASDLSEPVAPGSLGAGVSGSVPAPEPAPMRGSDAPVRAPKAAGGGGSPR